MHRHRVAEYLKTIEQQSAGSVTPQAPYRYTGNYAAQEGQALTYGTLSPAPTATPTVS